MLNMDRIQEIRNLDEDGSDAALKELITIFLESTPPRLKNLSKSFNMKDFTSVRHEAHSLRSSSYAIGAEGMGQLAEAVEYAQDSEQDYMLEHISRMLTEFENLKTELSALI
jgi:HPt (histidine-containing phosphotransfer) domain-containing protein